MYTDMMELGRISSRIAAILTVAAATFAAPAVVEADTPLTSATVIMTDSGFNPATVTIAAGGSVTWKNQGGSTHTATTVGGAPSTFNTAGIGSGQSATLALAVPGQYFYTSGTDCLNNVNNANFPCTLSYLITVVPANGAPLPSTVAVPAAPTVAPAPMASGPMSSATIVINDAGMSPAYVTLGLNGSVTWVNRGTNVHTATTTSDSNATSAPPFDTGGLAPGQSNNMVLTQPGTYSYLSSPDCLSRSNPTAGGFNCGPYTIVIGSAPAASPQPSQQAQPAAPAPPPAVVAGAAVTVAIDDLKGFQPNSVSVKVGQTVSWLDTGNNSHSVVVNQNPQPNAAVPWWLPYQLPSVGGSFFDSGGIGPQQSYSYTFLTPGTFPYHSSTEPLYQQNNTNCGCTFVTYQFFGTVNVTP